LTEGLIEGQAYFVVVTAYNSSNPSDESDYSNEVVGAIFAVATKPPGLESVVDSVTYRTPQTFGWAVGSSHSLSVTSPQAGPEGIRYVYSSWSDGGSQGHTVTASPASLPYIPNFVTQFGWYNLTTAVSPTGGGAVTFVPSSADNWFSSGDSVILTATGNSGYTFSEWSGGASGGTNPVTITMDGNKAVTANFTQDQYDLTVSVSPSGVGSVSRSPEKATYVYGDQVQLTAATIPGYTFSGWSGAASGTTNPVTTTMDGSKAVTANFTQDQYILMVSVSSSGVGAVSRSPEKATYVYGDRVQLTAAAIPGYTFSWWSGDARVGRPARLRSR